MKGLVIIMKLRMAAVAALIVCSLCSCGENRDKVGSIYTPAPVTPRPTFDTTRYRTKEEITAKQDSDFVIADTQNTNSYPSVTSEYKRVILKDNEAEALARDEKQRLIEEEEKRQEEEWLEQQRLAEQAVAQAKERAVAALNQAAKVQPVNNSYTDDDSLRLKDYIPEGFSSKNYPYSLYSNDGRTYLGKITFDIYNESMTDSIYTANGSFGSADSATSIYNPNSIFGSADSMFSAFNENASAPPKIIDSKGNFVGYLTSNLRIKDGIDPQTLKSYVSDNNL